jgi:hypothetical protein
LSSHLLISSFSTQVVPDLLRFNRTNRPTNPPVHSGASRLQSLLKCEAEPFVEAAGFRAGYLALNASGTKIAQHRLGVRFNRELHGPTVPEVMKLN